MVKSVVGKLGDTVAGQDQIPQLVQFSDLRQMLGLQTVASQVKHLKLLQ